MLVIGRKPGESIILNEEITINVIKIVGSQVTIGLLAPQEVFIRRDEIDPVTREKGPKIPATKLPMPPKY